MITDNEADERLRCSFKPLQFNTFQTLIVYQTVPLVKYEYECVKQELQEPIDYEVGSVIHQEIKCCGYRYISLPSHLSESNTTLPLKEEQFDSVVANSTSPTNTLTTLPSEGLQNSEKQKKINKTKLKKQLLLEKPEKKQLMEEYTQVKHQNSLKNIRDAFLRHVNSSGLSQEQKDIYSELMGGTQQFGSIKKKINVSLKENSTNNKCIKFMCKSSQVRPIFAYFLENIESLWLSESKVQTKDTTRAVVSLLLKFIDDTSAIDLIEHYHTRQ